MTRPLRAGTGMRLLRAAVFTAVCVVLSAGGHVIAAGHPVAPWQLLTGWFVVFAVTAPLAGRERRLPGIAAGLAIGQTALHLLFSAGDRCARQTTAAGAATTATPAHTAGGSENVIALAGRLLCAGHGTRLTAHTAARLLLQAGIDPARMSAAGAVAATRAGASAGASVGASTGIAGGISHGTLGGVSGATPTPAGAPYSLSMLIGHLLAALAAGWLLRRGDAALWLLAELSAGAARSAWALVRVLVAGALGEARSTPPRCTPRLFARGSEPGPPRTALLRHCVARRGPPALTLAA